MRKLLLSTLVVVFTVLPFGLGNTQIPKLGGSLEAGPVGSSLDDGVLSIALPVRNAGRGAVQGVRINRISVDGVEPLDYTKVPMDLGSIAPGQSQTVFASFPGKRFQAGGSYVITIAGTYRGGRLDSKIDLTQRFRVPPAEPGEAKASTSSSDPKEVKGTRYPPRRPAFDRDINEGTIWTVPMGKERSNEPSKESAAERAPQPREKNHAAPFAPVTFFTNAGLGINGNTINEPSGGVGGNVVFATANSFAAYSTNNGGIWTNLNPSTIFPNADGGFCCDQIVQYAPSIDRVIWLMQYRRASVPGPNRYRIAAASPADIRNSNGTAWTYWDITSTQLGFGQNWIDYPDMSLGNNSVYLSFDEVGFGLVVVRIPLAEIRDRVTIHFWYTDPNNSPMAYGGHLTQNTQDEIFWAGHNSNSQMRIFSWQESSTTYFWRDRNIGSWPNNNANLMSTSPDGQDWLTKLRDFPGNACLGSTRVRNQIWFAWGAPAGNNFRQPHVQWVAFNRSNNFSLVTQAQIWNSSYAFSYPALATNSQGEVGMSLEYGGGGNYENHVVGFWGDFVVYITTSTNVGTTRFGDYVTIRQDAANTNRFDAFGYGLRQTSGVTRSDTRYVVFGR